MENTRRKLYAINLPTNSDKRLLESIFGVDTIESLCVEPIQNSHESKAVEILFKDEGVAAQAKADFADDGFPIDDGENIMLLTYEEFENYVPLQTSHNKIETEQNNSEAIPITPPSRAESETIAVSPADSCPDKVDEVVPEAITDDEDETVSEKPIIPISHQNNGKWKPIPTWDPVDIEQNTGWEAVDDEPHVSYESQIVVGTVQPDDVTGQIDNNLEDPSEISIESVSVSITKYVEEKRINWGEINDSSELWQICDAISAAYNGLPDSLLKESLLVVLEEQINVNYNHWMRNHLHTLLRIWKMEVQNENTQPRDSQVVSEAPVYIPPPPVKRNSSSAKKKRGRHLLGVAEFLEQARAKYMTEEGELDVEENENGVFSIGGEELDFGMWGKINKIKEDGAVRAEHIPSAPKRRRVHTHRNAKKPALESPINGESSEKEQLTTQKKESEERKKEKEREEGEMSDSDEKSSAAESSSSSDESDTETKHRKKRTPHKSKNSPKQPNMTKVFNQFYQHRYAIIQSLPLQHKAAFLDVLKQTTASVSTSQQPQISMMMEMMMKSLQRT